MSLCLIISGLRPQLSHSFIEKCTITTTLDRIIASCSYPSNTVATGFQLIAHAQTEVHKLYTNRTTTNRQAPVSLLLEADQIYQITILAIRSGTGIVNSIAYSAPHQLLHNSTSSIIVTSNISTSTTVTQNGTYCVCVCVCVCLQMCV